MKHQAVSVEKNNQEGTSLTDQRQHVLSFLSEWKHNLQCPTDLGQTNLVEHEIRFTDEHRFKEPFWKVPPALVQEVSGHFKEMLEA